MQIVYISEINGVKNVKSNEQVAVNKNLDPVHNFFFLGCMAGCLQLKFFRTSEIVRNESS